MNKLNDNFLKILQTLGVGGAEALESGSTTPPKGEETTSSAGDSTPAPDAGNSMLLLHIFKHKTTKGILKGMYLRSIGRQRRGLIPVCFTFNMTSSLQQWILTDRWWGILTRL